MIPGSLARRYARALILLADNAMQREAFARGLGDFAQAMECADGSGSTLGGVLDSERYPLSERHNVLQAVCRRLGVDPTVAAFLRYVLDRGRIQESGTHAELIALNGRYAALYATQFGRRGGDPTETGDYPLFS